MALYDKDRIRTDEAALKRTEYPGSGLAVGLDATGERAQLVCWLLGRTSAERAKRLEIFRGYTGRYIGTVVTEANFSYPTITREGGAGQRRRTHVATTSDQTEKVAQLLGGPYNLKDIPQYLEPEEDVPRLTAYIRTGKSTKMSRAPKDVINFGFAARRQTYVRKPTEPLTQVPVESALRTWVEPGMGIAIPTYAENGELFSWPPAAVKFGGTMQETAEHIRSLLPLEHFVAVGVKEIGPYVNEDYFVLNR